MFPKRSRFIGQLFLCPLLLFCWAFDGGTQSRKPLEVFPLERDHIFIWVSTGAPEAARLQKLGLYTDGKVHKHLGQGTSSTVFSFENAYLELIWIEKLFLSSQPDYRRNYIHALGVRRLTGVKITSNPVGKFSETASTLAKNGVVLVKRGKSPHAELIFDGGSQGKVLDVRPTLPLSLRY